MVGLLDEKNNLICFYYSENTKKYLCLLNFFWLV
jgi:hypothetical protein